MIIENIMSDLKLNRGWEHFRFVFDVVLRPDKVIMVSYSANKLPDNVFAYVIST